jgi:hypothetical protein
MTLIGWDRSERAPAISGMLFCMYPSGHRANSEEGQSRLKGKIQVISDEKGNQIWFHKMLLRVDFEPILSITTTQLFRKNGFATG